LDHGPIKETRLSAREHAWGVLLFDPAGRVVRRCRDAQHIFAGEPGAAVLDQSLADDDRPLGDVRSDHREALRLRVQRDRSAAEEPIEERKPRPCAPGD